MTERRRSGMSAGSFDAGYFQLMSRASSRQRAMFSRYHAGVARRAFVTCSIFSFG